MAANNKTSLKKDGRFYFCFDEIGKIDPTKFDVCMPLTIESERYVNTHLKLNNAIIPSNDCINLCDDKLQFYNTLEKAGFKDYVPKVCNELEYPYILKKTIAEFGRNSFIIYNQECEKKHKEYIESIDYIKQELVSGFEEFTTHILFYDNKILYTKTFCFECMDPYFVKGSLYEEKSKKEVSVPTVLPIFREILGVIGYQGICCFDYKLKDGKPKIFEINPRVGGSLTGNIPEVLHEYIKAIKDTKK